MVLLLHMMKSYLATGMYVIIYSSFFVLKILVELRNNIVFSCAVINKRRCWTYMVPGKDMEDRFGEVEVGETDSIHVTVDVAIYNLWGMEEPDYVMSMMATDGSLLGDDTCK